MARVELLFVPELSGACTLDLEYQSGFDIGFDRPELRIGDDSFVGHVGYMHYVEGWGRLAVGGYLGAGYARPSGAEHAGDPFFDDDRHLAYTQFDLGVRARVRLASPELFTFTLGTWFEGGPAIVHGEIPDGDAFPRRRRGLRWAAGFEIGPGGLLHLDPYVFSHATTRFGIESIEFGDAPAVTLAVSLRLGFDFALR